MGKNAMARNKSAEALAAFKEAYESAPEYGEAKVLYATALIAIGDYVTSDELVTELSGGGGAPDQRIVSLYINQKQYMRIAQLAEKYVAAHPGDAQARVTQAVALYIGGNVARAIAVMEEARKIFPKDAVAFYTIIEQMKAGTLKVE